jgi:CspA family cold shock protein
VETAVNSGILAGNRETAYIHGATSFGLPCFCPDEFWVLTSHKPKTRMNRKAMSALRGTTQSKEAIMAQGTVKFFNTQKGFGFITPSDGSKDVFVHISAVERAGMSTLNEGQRLNYEVITERGKQAAGNLSNA